MKQKRALMVSLEKTPENSVLISLDDLVESGEAQWIRDVLFTHKEYDVSTFENLAFDEKELADFGYNIIARLYAFYKRGEV